LVVVSAAVAVASAAVAPPAAGEQAGRWLARLTDSDCAVSDLKSQAKVFMVSAKEMFTPEERERIEAAVRQVEQRTSGELVPLVVDESYDYPRTEIVGAGFFSLATATTLSWGFFAESLWHFLWLFAAGYLIFRLLIRNLPWLRRRLIHPAEIKAEVEEKAAVSFFELGLCHTRDRTGVLILISLFERRVHVLADRGINDAVPDNYWDGIVQTITSGIKRGETCAALCAAIETCGQLLEERFPAKADDTDELPNLIVEGDETPVHPD
jgi:putative membrane protein